jgi:hypothetical protein
MARELRIDGRMNIEAVQKEFNAIYPFIRLGIYAPEEKAKSEAGQPIAQLPANTSIADARKVRNPGEVSIHWLKKVAKLEQEFEEIYGLYVQVCFTIADGKRGYTSKKLDDLSLSDLNKFGESQGWQKDIYR